MRRGLLRSFAFVALAGAAVVAACAPFSGDDAAPSAPPATNDAGDDPGATNTTGVGAGSGAETGLPCDVQQLIENRCIGCHLASSTLPLLSYDDLVRPSKSDRTKSMAVMSLERMRDTARPMPPAPAVPPAAEEAAIFEAWVGKNMPRVSGCIPPTTSSPDAGVDPTNYDTPRVCTSKTMWTAGNGSGGRKGGGFGPGGGRDREDDDDYESPLMTPGRACITCHTIRGGPAYRVAGTVYPTAHEPDDCNGVNGGAEIVVTDALGVVRSLPVNSAGNFMSDAFIPAPFHVKVKQGANEREMRGRVTAGDCNSCHSEQGANGAPGRVMAP